VGVEGEAPRSQIYTDSLQLSNAFLRRFVAQSVHHLPYSLQKKLQICANPIIQHGGGKVGTCPPVAYPCPPVATLLLGSCVCSASAHCSLSAFLSRHLLGEFPSSIFVAYLLLMFALLYYHITYSFIHRMTVGLH